MVAKHGAKARVPRTRYPWVMGTAVLLVPFWSTGCATTTHGQLVEFLRAHEAEVATGSYVVQAPDAIEIHAPGAPEIDGVTETVRPDGKVPLRLLGDVDVAGLTTDEIAEKLRVLLSRYYVDPVVEVEVAAYRSQYYYVFGQVGGAGPKPYTGRDTLLRALSESQPTFLAWRSRVRVTRPSPKEQERKTIIVDLANMVRTGDLTQNILLQPGDIIEVPPTPLAWVGLRVRELLYPVDPVIQAYNAPARLIEAHETYHEDDGNNNNNNDRRRFFGNR